MKLNKIAKVYNNVTIVDTNLHRKCITRHGLHLTFIVRHLNPVFVLTVRSFLRDGPLNAQCACRGLER